MTGKMRPCDAENCTVFVDKNKVIDKSKVMYYNMTYKTSRLYRKWSDYNESSLTYV